MRLPTLFLALGLLATLHAAEIKYTAFSQATNATTHPWVGGSTMWGALQSGTSTATSIDGFTSLVGATPSLFSWTYGDLELTNFIVPTASTPGQEVYSEGDASVVPLNFYYNGVLLATGTVFDITVNVDHVNDFTAVGTATGRLTAAGADATFFNEVMSLTGGTGNLSFTVGDFYPVNNSGAFTSAGVLTFPASAPVPDAGRHLSCLAAALGLSASLRLRMRR